MQMFDKIKMTAKLDKNQNFEQIVSKNKLFAYE